MAKIIVGMSGGVDSAVVAHLLKKEGHEVIGVFMRNWDSAANNDILGNPNVNASVCPEEDDWKDVKILSNQIGIPVHRVDFVTEYWNNVFEDLITQYKAGRTPNPDILCNKYVKFGAFKNWVDKNISNYDYIAMGHYAHTENGNLYRALDKNKDQTYFLSQVNHKDLKKVIFPLGKLKKNKVRKIAEENNLIVANKKDSTGICFIGERNFTLFLQNYIPTQPGNIVSAVDGKVIGKHIGAMYYTIGQRKGLQLGGMKEPHFVAGHDLKNKIIYASPASDMSYIISTKCEIIDINLNNKDFDYNNLTVKFRYRQNDIKVKVKFFDNKALLYYPQGEKSVALGQQAVIYDGNKCLGGGTINKVYVKKDLYTK
ncbi:MAG: tRNA 2-thiouridine(34) synthase MnmA [Mollicutes bacterium PWAP]|nr:tRNA 2-thiouridine(34) synthase MnmA [Mollicutes bacterium PWAP]